ncbi:MAG: PQQ-dependent sugar dehydrogenase [Planctomycetota bacterium]
MLRLESVCAASLAASVGLVGAAASAQSYTAERVMSGLSSPTVVAAVPGDRSRMLVGEQSINGSQARIRVFDVDSSALLPDPFAVFTVSTGGERGLLGLAFHPDFETNGLVYLSYTFGGGSANGSNIVVEAPIDANDPNKLDFAAARPILLQSQPFSNHNGGWIDFGPDGYLYMAIGDGGAGDDPQNNSANKNNRLGAMLRIDVNGDDFLSDPNNNFAIPADNPFVGVAGDDAIWAYGLRNHWRNDFDPLTGDLYIADVGQGAREEVNFQPASSSGGENYGWRCWEGTRFNGFSGCGDTQDITFPVNEYRHSSPDFGCSITGGVMYRGCGIPSLRGAYLFADYCTDRIYALRQTSPGVFEREELTSRISTTSGFLGTIINFSRDADGEVYISSGGGSIFKLTASESSPDVNRDGLLDVDDFSAFVMAFFADDFAADQDDSGVLDIDDFSAFVSRFFEFRAEGGCL